DPLQVRLFIGVIAHGLVGACFLLPNPAKLVRRPPEVRTGGDGVNRRWHQPPHHGLSIISQRCPPAGRARLASRSILSSAPSRNCAMHGVVSTSSVSTASGSGITSS